MRIHENCRGAYAAPVTSTTLETIYPGARRPDRSFTVDGPGPALAAYEWGDPTAPPVLLTHGGFDFAATFDLLAPILADAGWRVVAWDQRGHGDSEHAALYSWAADVHDAVAVMDAIATGPMPVIGHSKGGGLMLHLAEIAPWRLTRLVNLDGIPSNRKAPDVADHERTRLLADGLSSWLDHRRRLHEVSRRPGTPEELAVRRQEMNPRLPLAWLRYVALIGARQDADGWRWKIDPSLRMGGFGPFRPEWNLHRLPGLSVPMLGLLSTEDEPMGWGTDLAGIESFLAPETRVVEMHGVGHFLHIEEPAAVADLVLEFLS